MKLWFWMLCMCVCMHSRFIENHPIWILEDGLLISEVLLSHIWSFRVTRFHSIHFHGVSSAPSRTPLLPHHGVASHVSKTTIGLPLLFIQERDKMRRPSVNQSFQRIIVDHKRGHVKILIEKIIHNNSVRTRNMNQLSHTIGTSVLRESHHKPLGPTMFIARCRSNAFKNLVLPGFNVKECCVHTLRTSLISFCI
jgi:hypothetical protein